MIKTEANGFASTDGDRIADGVSEIDESLMVERPKLADEIWRPADKLFTTKQGTVSVIELWCKGCPSRRLD
jgi:hypothetical protein